MGKTSKGTMGSGSDLLGDDGRENRTISGRFAPGNRANPGGRPKGLAARIREQWPAERLEAAFAEIAANPKTSNRDRMEALRWLGERGYGRTPEIHMVGAMTEDQREAASELTRDQLLSLIDTAPVVAALPAVLESQLIEDAEVTS